MVCPRCQGEGWICDQHPSQPYPHGDCIGPGNPCPVCQDPSRPRQPDDWVTIARRTDPPPRHAWTLTKADRQIACWLTCHGESYGWETQTIENDRLSTGRR